MKEVIRRITDKRIKSFEKNFIWFVLGLSFILVAFRYDSGFLDELSIIVMMFMIIPLNNGLKDLIYILFPTKTPIFRQLKHIGNKAAICEYILKQEEQKIYEDDVVMITPKLIIDKINFENAVLLDNIYSISLIITTKKNKKEEVKLKIECYNRKNIDINYPDTYDKDNLQEKANETIKKINEIANNGKTTKTQLNSNIITHIIEK
ncbi:MAG: hypothetical protein IJN90_01570 [Bacilli bacterium]|nr:hypothetical protein [Bacilli bacterium]